MKLNEFFSAKVLLTTRTNSVFSTKRVNVLAFLFGVGVDDDVVARVVDVDVDVHRPSQQKPDRLIDRNIFLSERKDRDR